MQPCFPITELLIAGGLKNLVIRRQRMCNCLKLKLQKIGLHRADEYATLEDILATTVLKVLLSKTLWLEVRVVLGRSLRQSLA